MVSKLNLENRVVVYSAFSELESQLGKRPSVKDVVGVYEVPEEKRTKLGAMLANYGRPRNTGIARMVDRKEHDDPSVEGKPLLQTRDDIYAAIGDCLERHPQEPVTVRELYDCYIIRGLTRGQVTAFISRHTMAVRDGKQREELHENGFGRLEIAAIAEVVGVDRAAKVLRLDKYSVGSTLGHARKGTYGDRRVGVEYIELVPQRWYVIGKAGEDEEVTRRKVRVLTETYGSVDNVPEEVLKARGLQIFRP